MFKSNLHTFDFGRGDPELIFLASENGTYNYADLDRFTAFFEQTLSTHADSLKWPVAFLSDSSDVLVFAIAACWKLGVPFIPLSPKLPQQELEGNITKLHPSIIFCDTKNLDRLSGDDVFCLDQGYLTQALTDEPTDSTEVEYPKIDSDSIAGYFFTSGSTGSPKIVPLKRRQVLSAAKASALNFKPEPSHFWLLCLPLNHVGGITIILRTIIYGSAIYRLDYFKEEIIKEFLINNLRFQVISLVPTMLLRLLNDSLFKTHRKFKAILLGGAPVTKDILKTSLERGIPVVSSYGMTETCAQIVANPLGIPSGTYTPLQSVGKIFAPNSLQIRDENQKVLGKNQSGTIWLRGPQVFDGYYDKIHNENRFDENGWFNTGDFGRLNLFGALFIESRREDLIITGGENVNPQEVEQAILKIPTIKEAVVLGVEDEEWGQKVVAFITLKNGKEPQLNDVRNLLRSDLPDFKLPKELCIITEIPKTDLGKVKRKELLKLFK
ncbi:MAG: o-succinylbenzoate--CoA ligase [Balneolaceae bacterium]